MLKTILVPPDGSELAARALTCATALALRTGARLWLVRTVEVDDERSARPGVGRHVSTSG
jgi:hypothetical protein